MVLEECVWTIDLSVAKSALAVGGAIFQGLVSLLVTGARFEESDKSIVFPAVNQHVEMERETGSTASLWMP